MDFVLAARQPDAAPTCEKPRVMTPSSAPSDWPPPPVAVPASELHAPGANRAAAEAAARTVRVRVVRAMSPPRDPARHRAGAGLPGTSLDVSAHKVLTDSAWRHIRVTSVPCFRPHGNRITTTASTLPRRGSHGAR